MHTALLFVAMLGCSEYGLGQGPNGGDYGDAGEGPYAYGEGDSLEGDDDGTRNGITGDGDGWDTGAEDDITWDDDGDYVPEHGEGCDEATDMDAIQIDGDGKVFVCHTTGSDNNPSVLINIDVAGCEEHRVHHDGRDGLPTDGCRP